MKNLKESVLVLALLLGASMSCWSESAIITHPSFTDAVSPNDIAKVFLAKSKKLAGKEVQPLNLGDDSAVRQSFENTVLKKSPSQVKAYWSQLIFTGKAVPIEVMDDEAAMVAKVAKTPGAIGYVSSAAVTPEVRVLVSF